MRSTNAFFLSVLLCSAPATAAAQLVRGATVDRTALPVSGVVVMLVDSVGRLQARALSGDQGDYSLRAPFAGTFHLRALRIGFQPVISGNFVLTAGTVHSERLVLDGARISLAAVRISAQSACGRLASSDAGSVFTVWDQAMTSVSAAMLTSVSRGLTATTMKIERTLAPNGRRIVTQNASVSTDYVTQPWKSLPADTLRRNGYTVTDATGATTYYAPGLDVLSSAVFLEDHCIRLVKARDTTEIGVAFEPNQRRWRNAEIRGTLWIDRATADLRRLEFGFMNVGAMPEVADLASGGNMTFVRVRNGAVVISHWEIRMPELERGPTRNAAVRVATIIASGGELVALRRAADTLYRRPTLSVIGAVVDSLSGRAVSRATVSLEGTTTQATTDADGRFRLNDVLPGEYAVLVRTPSLDSILAATRSATVIMEGMPELRLRVPTASQLTAALCGKALEGSSGYGKGAIFGHASHNSDTARVSRIRVVADWIDGTVQYGRITAIPRRIETFTDSSGRFRLCGVPTEQRMTVRAQSATGRAQPVTVLLAPDQRVASEEIVIDDAAMAVASLHGMIVAADSSATPLRDADVSLPDLSLTSRSGERGEFHIDDIPVGTHRVIVRHLGYSALDTRLTFTAGEREERRIVLSRVTVLDSVSVKATRLDPAMNEFEEHRKLGLGHFLTRNELAKNDGRRMSDLLATFPGVGIVQGKASRGWILSHHIMLGPAAAAECKRGVSNPGSIQYVPDKGEIQQGVQCGCYAQVYLDGSLMNAGKPTEPFDVNSIPPGSIEAIEWYSGPAQTPSQYSRLNSACGVYVIHTRRPDSN